jgi:predicted nucleic acid-binding protein
VRSILIDTSVLIDFLRRSDKENTLFHKISDQELFISIVSHTEVFTGKSVWESEKTRQIVEHTLLGLTIIPLTLDISRKAGFVRAYNQNISLIDALIGATAQENNLEVATLNIRHFENIEGIKLLPHLPAGEHKISR